MPVIRVFLDTEFTCFENPKLISLALVAETGQEFYAELTDGWSQRDCSHFVLDEVLPLLTVQPKDRVMRTELKKRLIDWFEQLAAPPVLVQIIFDASIDWHLLTETCGNLNTETLDIQPQWLEWPGNAMARRFLDLQENHFRIHGQRHNARSDAHGLRTAYLITHAEFSSPPTRRNARHE
ncbi:hypothetical protein MASR1M60_05320 [Rhodocyclaceae bacterium]